uniref:Uncharacterized protein n=1 Tax=Arundo donax TaxID=35708 RepID=A0A0A9ERQ3_ARUDO
MGPFGSQTFNKRAFSFILDPNPSHSSHSSFLNHDKYMTGPSVDGTRYSKAGWGG